MLPELVLALGLAGGSRAEPIASTHVTVVIPDRPATDLDENTLAAIRAHARLVDVEPSFERRLGSVPELHRLTEASRTIADQNGAAAVLWVDLDRRETLTLLLWLRTGDRLYERRIPVEGSTPAAIEMLATVASTAIATLTTDRIRGMQAVDPDHLERGYAGLQEVVSDPSRAPTVRSRARSQTPGPAEPWRRLRFAAGYSGNTFARPIPWQHAIELAAGYAPSPTSEVGLTYGFVFPSEVRDAVVAFELRRHPISVFGSYRFRAGRRAEIGPLAALRVDPIVRVADPGASVVPVAEAKLRVYASILVGPTIEIITADWLRLRLGLSAEVVLTRARYVSEVPTQRVLVEPHPARFVVVLSVVSALLPR